MVIPCGTYIGICGCIELLLLVEWKLFPVAAANGLILQQLPAKKVLHQPIETPRLLALQLGKEIQTKTPKAEDLFKKESTCTSPKRAKCTQSPIRSEELWVSQSILSFSKAVIPLSALTLPKT